MVCKGRTVEECGPVAFNIRILVGKMGTFCVAGYMKGNCKTDIFVVMEKEKIQLEMF